MRACMGRTLGIHELASFGAKLKKQGVVDPKSKKKCGPNNWTCTKRRVALCSKVTKIILQSVLNLKFNFMILAPKF